MSAKHKEENKEKSTKELVDNEKERENEKENGDKKTQENEDDVLNQQQCKQQQQIILELYNGEVSFVDNLIHIPQDFKLPFLNKALSAPEGIIETNKREAVVIGMIIRTF